jgi:hypothetical protein
LRASIPVARPRLLDRRVALTAAHAVNPPSGGCSACAPPAPNRHELKVVTAPRFVLPCSRRDEERPARFALASGGSNKEQWRASQQEAPAACRLYNTPRTNAATAAQPQVFTPSPLCKSVACRRTYFDPVTVCKSVARRTLRDLANPSPMTSPAGRRLFCIFDARSHSRRTQIDPPRPRRPQGESRERHRLPQGNRPRAGAHR